MIAQLYTIKGHRDRIFMKFERDYIIMAVLNFYFVCILLGFLQNILGNPFYESLV